jgi:16S rRNA (adenine1518-N6/adenine1519-N6)-dimethyltransferase
VTPAGDRPPPTLKRLGQHFLTDKRILAQIADATGILPGETIVEIGPGRGALTDVLVERASRLVMIELDRALAARLRERYAGLPHVEVVEGDVLGIALASLVGDAPWRLVGNVPYYITTPILFHALTRPRPACAVFLVQREVAERACAPAGSDGYGALSVNLQVLVDPSMRGIVKPGAFNPPPKVDSAILRVDPLAEPLVTTDEEAAFSRFVVAAFGQRRKQLRRVLRGVRGLDADVAEAALVSVGLSPEARPETLTPAQFVALFRALPASP